MRNTIRANGCRHYCRLGKLTHCFLLSTWQDLIPVWECPLIVALVKSLDLRSRSLPRAPRIGRSSTELHRWLPLRICPKIIVWRVGLTEWLIVLWLRRVSEHFVNTELPLHVLVLPTHYSHQLLNILAALLLRPKTRPQNESLTYFCLCSLI